MRAVSSTSNPVLSNNFWSNIPGYETMSYEGTMQKIGVLFGITILTALVTVSFGFSGGLALMSIFWLIGFSGILITMAVMLIARPKNPAVGVTIFSVFEGMFAGSVSFMFESQYSGIILQAGLGTVCIIGVMYFLWSAKIIKATPAFQAVVISLTGAIFALYMVSFVLSLFTSISVPFLHSSGPIGILVTLFILGVASFNLILDFHFIERGISSNSPKTGEWWAAFGLLITVIWVYYEMLRLLAKLRDQ
ncbi:MAG TPA: Bax inhibitor-1/YccA family protein [Candidatus Poseidoniales archaeon]|nr:MAG TPA: Bax inhibitor-1/YccA family protein [Candidatus Poseidoniales archaeon]HII86363.1 Bax inhibitor-1/YccA family protein [Candidatus Poseidoniaceae archaeon]